MSSSDYRDPTTWRGRTPVNGFPYRIVNTSGEFNEEGASSVKLTILMEARNVFKYAEELFPDPIFTGAFFVPPPSQRHPTLPQFGARKMAWKRHVEGLPIDPFDTDPEALTDPALASTYGTVCELTITYDTGSANGDSDNNSDNDNPETFLEISSSATGDIISANAPNGEYDQVPEQDQNQQQLQDTTNRRPTIPITVEVPQIEWTARWPRVPQSLWREAIVYRLRSMLGKVNKFTVPWLYSAPPETLLFVGWGHKEQYTWRAGYARFPFITVDMKFVEKNIVFGFDITGFPRSYGHNHVWKDGTGWTKLKHDGENYIYRETDYIQLFNTGPLKPKDLFE